MIARTALAGIADGSIPIDGVALSLDAQFGGCDEGTWEGRLEALASSMRDCIAADGMPATGCEIIVSLVPELDDHADACEGKRLMPVGAVEERCIYDGAGKISPYLSYGGQVICSHLSFQRSASAEKILSSVSEEDRAFVRELGIADTPACIEHDGIALHKYHYRDRGVHPGDDPFLVDGDGRVWDWCGADGEISMRCNADIYSPGSVESVRLQMDGGGISSIPSAIDKYHVGSRDLIGGTVYYDDELVSRNDAVACAVHALCSACTFDCSERDLLLNSFDPFSIGPSHAADPLRDQVESDLVSEIIYDFRKRRADFHLGATLDAMRERLRKEARSIGLLALSDAALSL